MLILNGQQVPTPGLETISWLDDPEVPQATDFYQRTMWIRAIVIHTVKGINGPLKPGKKDSKRAETYAQYQAQTARQVGWDYTVDTDGTIIVSNDPIKRATWHAGSVNPFTIGIEMVQDNDGSVYEFQMETMVGFIDRLVIELADREHPIQRQVPMTTDGKPVRGVIPRIQDPSQAKKVVGIYGHRNQTSDRGVGDPGDHIFKYLLQAGYKGFNFDGREDVTFWKSVQKRLGFTADGTDGIPGRDVQKALKSAGYPHGMYVSRPGD